MRAIVLSIHIGGGVTNVIPSSAMQLSFGPIFSCQLSKEEGYGPGMSWQEGKKSFVLLILCSRPKSALIWAGIFQSSILKSVLKAESGDCMMFKARYIICKAQGKTKYRVSYSKIAVLGISR